MNCPRCDADGREIEARESSAKCRRCGLVFDPLRVRPRAGNATLGPAAPLKGLVVPYGFDALEREIGLKSVYRDARSGKGELVITRRWATTSAMVAPPGSLPPIVMPFACLVFSLIGFFGHGRDGRPLTHFGYMTLAMSVLSGLAIAVWQLNRTRIAVEDGRLRVSHGPFPWFGARDVDAASVEQLFCDSAGRGRDGGERFRVLAFLRGRDEPLVLVNEVPDPGHALFLEEAIERTLGIRDRPVEAELPFKKNRAAAGRR